MTDVVANAVRTWKRLGIPPADAAEMAQELRADLDAARADGRSAEEFVGGDPDGLARAWAAARGLTTPRPRLAAVTGLAVLGMLPGGALTLLAMTLPSSLVFNDMTGHVLLHSDGTGHGIFYTYPSYDGVLRLLAYPVGLLVSAAGSVLVVSSFLRSVADPVRARTVRYLVRGLPLIAVAAVAAGVAAAASTGFSYGVTAIWRPTAAALATTALGVVAARYLSVRADLAGPTGPPLDDVVAEA